LSRQARAWRDFVCLGLASEVRDKALGTNSEAFPFWKHKGENLGSPEMILKEKKSEIT
jgi:hypothetical protein